MNRFFQTPPVVKNLLIINVLIYMVTELLPFGNDVIRLFALFNPESPFFHSYQVVTYMFLHGNLGHLFFNMFALWMFGRGLEEYDLRSPRFLTYYLVCGVGAALLQLGVGWIEYGRAVSMHGAAAAQLLLQIPTVGASGAVFGLLLAFGLLHPNMTIMLLIPPIPIKAKWFVIIYGLLELYLGMSGRQPGVAHFAHVGGMLWGFLLLHWWKHRGIIRF